jgi:YVTN family beta-propeller protein
VSVGNYPYGVGYAPTSDRIYVANNTSGTVSVINPSTNTVVATVSVGLGLYGIGYAPTSDRIYVANYGGGNVSVIRAIKEILYAV